MLRVEGHKDTHTHTHTHIGTHSTALAIGLSRSLIVEWMIRALFICSVEGRIVAVVAACSSTRNRMSERSSTRPKADVTVSSADIGIAHIQLITTGMMVGTIMATET